MAPRNSRAAALALAAAAGLAASAPAAAQQTHAVLQGLDKITARITTIEAPVGQPVRFGTLSILVKRCHKRPPEETPEKTAFLEIEERRAGQAPEKLFAGWMFASVPAVAALEHPVYDVWVVDCRNASSSAGSRSGSNDADTSSAAESSSR